MAHRHQLGIRAGLLTTLTASATLLGWWSVLPVCLDAVAEAGTGVRLAPAVITAASAAGALGAGSWIALSLLWCTCTTLWTAGAPRPGAPRASRLAPRWVARLVTVALGAAVGASFAAPTSAISLDRPASGGAPDALVPHPQAPHLTGLRLPDRPTGRTATVVVRDGDSLWSITADVLGTDATPPQIVRSVAALYATNRPRIGPDPDLIHPGLALRLPLSLAPLAPTGERP